MQIGAQADLYIETVGNPQLRALQERETARESIAAMLRLAISNLSPRGSRACQRHPP